MKLLTKEQKSPKNIHDGIILVYFTVKYQSKQFRWNAFNPNICMQVETMLLEYRRLKVLTIARALNISEPSVLTILQDKLGMSMVSARFVPRSLTPDKNLNKQ